MAELAVSPYTAVHRPRWIDKQSGSGVGPWWRWTCVCGTRGAVLTREQAVTALRQHAAAKQPVIPPFRRPHDREH